MIEENSADLGILFTYLSSGLKKQGKIKFMEEVLNWLIKGVFVCSYAVGYKDKNGKI